MDAAAGQERLKRWNCTSLFHNQIQEAKKQKLGTSSQATKTKSNFMQDSKQTASFPWGQLREMLIKSN